MRGRIKNEEGFWVGESENDIKMWIIKCPTEYLLNRWKARYPEYADDIQSGIDEIFGGCRTD